MKTKKFFKALVSLAMGAVMMCSAGAMTAFADTTAAALSTMEEYIATAGKDSSSKDGAGLEKAYICSEGGTLTYDDCVDDKGYLVEANFNKLNQAAKEELLTDMIGYADKCIETADAEKGITEDVKTNWLQTIQSSDGVGSQLMNTLLQNTKPDYVTANKIYEPFSGVVGTVMALGAILIMAFLGITMVLDLSYIGIPAFRLVMGGGEGKDKPKIISHEAVSAVAQAENGDGGKTEKVAVGIYFKKRVIMLVILGVCLLYLIQGQIFTLVSWILNLLSGFLGF